MAKKPLTAEEKKLIRQAYVGSLSCMRVTGSVTGMGKAMALAAAPFINRFYKTDEEKREAIARNGTEYMNTHQAMFGLIAGITCAMERERAEKGSIEAGSITAMKASLMGPLAGIGDSFFFNCYRLIIASVSIGLSANGNILGPLFFLVFYGFGLLAIKYVFVREGYRNGVTLVEKASEQGIIPLLMEAASTLGCLMVGALIASNMKINIALAPVINGAQIPVQGVFDTIMPGLLCLLMFFGVMKLVKKGWSPIKLIFGIMGCCILLSFLGIL